MQRNVRYYFALTIFAASASLANAQNSEPDATAPSGAIMIAVVDQRPPIKPTIKEDPKQWAERVKTRAQARWQLISEKKFAESHAFLSVASRAFLPQDQYIANVSSAQYADGTVTETVCVEDSCTAVVTAFILQSVPRVPQRILTPLQIRERWIVEDGDAYLLQR